MEILGLYANRNSHQDFMHNAIESLSNTPSNVYIAVAFFTEESVVEQLVHKGCKVRLIVRLGNIKGAVSKAKGPGSHLVLSASMQIRGQNKGAG